VTEPWYQEAAEQYIEKLARVLEASAPTRRLLDSVFGDFLATVEAPAPEPTLYPFFLHSAILRDLASELSYPFGPELSQRISAIVPLHRVEGTSVRVRHLGLPGLYPNADFRSGSALYIIRSGVPVLITKNSHRYEALWSGGSELDNWTRHETRLATALSCTEYGGFSMYLTHDMRNFPMECLEHVNVDQRVDFMLAYVGLCSAIRQHYRYAYLRPSHEHVGRFQYGDFRPHEKLARRFAAAFLISHPLLLRTARHFLRGSMLWRTDAFTEDALAHIMFALVVRR
jgi:hypothetical protein